MAHTTATNAPMPTAVPKTWRQVTLPAGHTLDDHSGLEVSSQDGSAAWFCGPTSGETFAVWSTHDTGQTWQQASTLVPGGPAAPWGCALTADQRDPHTLVVIFTSGAGAAGDLRSISYLSTDDGVHWTRIPGLVGIGQLASGGGKLYAILTDTADPATEFPQVVVSTDGLQTWKAIRPSGLAAQDALFHFWLDLSHGQLFAASYQGTFWQATDDGATWTQLPQIPATRPPQVNLGAWLPQQNQWEFCGWSAPPMVVQCTTTLGGTWPAGPELTVPLACADCAPNVPPPDAQNCYPNALQADGALLAVCPTAGSSTSAPTFGVYRLPFNGLGWQRVAMAPAPLLTAPTIGAVWYAAQGNVFTATLPA